jgi:hypothetical protein
MRGGEVNITCSFGRGVKGGFVAGDSMTQLVICERMRLHFGMDMVTVVVMIRSSSSRITNSLDGHVGGRNRISS